METSQNFFENNINIDSNEPLLMTENNRLTVYPIMYHNIWSAYKTQVAAFWTAEEIDFSKDYKDFCSLNENEQHFIKMVLAFFAASDTIVNINLGERFIREVQLREAIVAYGFQMMMESIHSEVYSLMIDNIVKDTLEKNKLLNAITEYPCISNKALWAKKWIESNSTFAQRLIAFAIVEGIFFSGSFCAIYWIKKKNLMPGLCDSNELISRDEGLHCDFACLLYTKHLVNKLSKQQVREIIMDAVTIEKEFVTDAIPVKLIGMNSDLMTQYIEFVADRLLTELGNEKEYNATNPFDFMEMISLQGKSNFFEKRVGEYQKAGVLAGKGNLEFTMNEEF